MKQRCVNLDWVEVYCLESGKNFPHDADYFRECGYFVREREYGTRQYNQMFTILDENDLGFVEVRRDPVSGSMANKNTGIFSPYSCHIRLCNRYCYHEQAIFLLSDFLLKHGYEVQRIFRLDIAMDFEKFDKGDDPHEFLRRYMSGRYTKINQGNVSAHGKDRWECRDWNSVSWGAPTSMVSTKFYCKSLELREAKDKPYIRYAWQKAGLIDDFNAMTKNREDGTTYQPDIWRVEFSIRSSARGWYVIEDANGNKVKTLQREHTLGTYNNKHDILIAFASLAHCYFHFKKYKEGVRKDRCEDKILFDFGENHVAYKLDRLMSDAPKDKSIDALLKRLIDYKATHPQENVCKACNVLIQQLQREGIRSSMPNPYDRNEELLLQQLISMRIQNPDLPLKESYEILQTMLNFKNEIF